jgi:hypothetical protein
MAKLVLKIGCILALLLLCIKPEAAPIILRWVWACTFGWGIPVVLYVRDHCSALGVASVIVGIFALVPLVAALTRVRNKGGATFVVKPATVAVQPVMPAVVLSSKPSPQVVETPVVVPECITEEDLAQYDAEELEEQAPPPQPEAAAEHKVESVAVRFRDPSLDLV